MSAGGGRRELLRRVARTVGAQIYASGSMSRVTNHRRGMPPDGTRSPGASNSPTGCGRVTAKGTGHRKLDRLLPRGVKGYCSGAW